MTSAAQLGRWLATLALALALLVAQRHHQGAVVECQHFGPRVNKHGVWLPNPVQEVRNEIRRLKWRLSPEHYYRRRKHELYNQVPGYHKVHRIEHKIRNIKNAIKY